MQRRSLLQFPVLASLAQAAPPAAGFKLSVRVEALFRDMNLPQMMEKVAEAGYQGFEFGNWRGRIVPLSPNQRFTNSSRDSGSSNCHRWKPC